MPMKCELLVFDWQIKNAILCSRSKDIFLETPVFLSQDSCTWKLEFGRQLSEKLCCGLRRCDVNVSESVYAQFQCSIRNDTGMIWCTKKSNFGKYDSKNSVCQLELEDEFCKETRRLMNVLSLDDSNTLSFKIMIYYFDKLHTKQLNSEYALTAEREKFAQRMVQGFISGKYSDVVLKLKNKEFKAHKAILYARSLYFAEVLENEPSIKTIEMNDIEEDAIEKVLHCIYSDRPYILKEDLPLPFGFYECAENLGVKNLTAVFALHKLKCCSEISSELCMHKWFIPNFSNLGPTGRLLSSSVKSKPTSKEEFRFIVCLADTQNAEKDIGIFVEMLEGNCPLQALFRVSLLDSHNRLCCTQQVLCSLEKNKVFGFDNFIDRKYLEKEKALFLSADTLTVGCSLKFSAADDILVSNCMLGQRFSHAGEKLIKFPNFQKLFEIEIFFDIILSVQGVEFYSHRILLSSCSRVFEVLIDILEKNNEHTLTIDGTPPLVNALLEYIYTRNVNLTSDVAFGLYHLSKKFEVLELNLICSSFLLENIDNESACKVFSIAIDYRDIPLAGAAKIYLTKNIRQIPPEELLSLVSGIFTSLSANN